MATRPVVNVYKVDTRRTEDRRDVKAATVVGQAVMPTVFSAPIRRDIIEHTQNLLRRNQFQVHAVSRKAGHQTSAESWGTGRAVARIPRVAGGGTHRAGQGAFGNMCRGGRMSNPTKSFRRLHVRVPVKARRYAAASSLAASAVPAFVMARGHRVEEVPEFPLVVSDEVESFKSHKMARRALKSVGGHSDIVRVRESRRRRAGKGKARGRRYVMAVGPLIVYKNDNGIVDSFKDIKGVDVRSVHELSVLDLAPGGHMGRFIVFTQSAFEELDKVFGTFRTESTYKKGFTVPMNVMTNADVHRILQSEEIQSVLRPAIGVSAMADKFEGMPEPSYVAEILKGVKEPLVASKTSTKK